MADAVKKSGPPAVGTDSMEHLPQSLCIPEHLVIPARRLLKEAGGDMKSHLITEELSSPSLGQL